MVLFYENAKKLLTPEIVQLMSTIYEHKGKQQLFVAAKKDTLNTLMEIARIKSTKSSDRIQNDSYKHIVM